MDKTYCISHTLFHDTSYLAVKRDSTKSTTSRINCRHHLSAVHNDSMKASGRKGDDSLYDGGEIGSDNYC